MQEYNYIAIKKFALMINYTPESQLSIDLFQTPFEAALSPDNRWVKLSKVVPWDKFASIYIKKMRADFGRPGISPRTVLGAMIIKHIEKLDDRGVIQAIQENIYMQYFVGLKGYQAEPIFHHSLFSTLRERIGVKEFDELNQELIKWISTERDKKHISRSRKKQNSNNSKDKNTQQGETSSKNSKTDNLSKQNDSSDNKNNTEKESTIPNKGKLQLDATVADQYITYPTDTKLLNQSRKECEILIDKLYQKLKEKDGKYKKPRTYRRVLDKQYLRFSKKRRKSKKEIRKTNRIFLEALKRDIKHINNMLDKFEEFPLTIKEQRMLWIVSLVYEQQKQMYDNKTQSVKHRIVSIYQPHVRPIPRGKDKSQIEFGSKLGVSYDQGLTRINTLSWEAYNESSDFKKQVMAYKDMHGFYPELVQVDSIYATKENRQWAKARGIRLTAKPLGRPKKVEVESYYEKRKRKKEAAERNKIEGKFGQGKNGYDLNKVRAKLKKTSESWIAAIFFIMNLIHLKDIGIFLSNFQNYLNSFLHLIVHITFLCKLKFQKYILQYQTVGL